VEYRDVYLTNDNPGASGKQVTSESNPGTDEETKPSYSTLLKMRSFAALWTGQVISQSGDGIFDVVLLWVVWKLTSSLFLVGLTQAVVLVPSILVGPFAGVFADRRNRRDLMIASSLFQGGVTAGITALYFTGWFSFSPLLILVLLLFTGAEFYRAANSSIIPSIVPKDQLGAANGLFSLSTQTNQLVSYALGGIVLAIVGAAAAISYDSLTFFVAAGLLTMVTRNLGNPRSDESESVAVPRKSFWKQFREGLSYIRTNRLFVELSVFGLIVNFLGGGTGAVIAPYVGKQLGGDSVAYGFILASFALGGIAGAVIIGKLNFRYYVGKLLFGGVFLFGPLTILAGLASNVLMGFVAFLGLGLISGAVNLPIQVLVQTQVPREMLGRAATVLRALLSMATPIAAIAFGAMAFESSIEWVFVVSGAGTSILTAALYLPFRELRSAKY
jgi:MFS family permease